MKKFSQATDVSLVFPIDTTLSKVKRAYIIKIINYEVTKIAYSLKIY